MPNQNVIGDDKAPDDGTIENHDGDNIGSMKQGASFLFSDHARARITTVKCRHRSRYLSISTFK